MTRFAKKGTLTTKKPHEASSWAELKKGWELCSKYDEKGHSPGQCRRTPGPSRTPGIPENNPKDDNKNSKKNNQLERKRERRREEKRLKRMRLKEMSKACQFCSEKGHEASDCPVRITTGRFGACIKCGSTEHTADDCRGGLSSEQCATCHQKGHGNDDCPNKSTDEDSVPDRCPLCDEFGHQVKGCPDNPRSIYPMGGSCKECGSVEHKAAHCTEREPTNAIEEVTVSTLHFGSRISADAHDVEKQTTGASVKKKKAKVVLF